MTPSLLSLVDGGGVASFRAEVALSFALRAAIRAATFAAASSTDFAATSVDAGVAAAAASERRL